MHFEFTVTAGQVGVLVTLLGCLWRFEHFANRMLMEHEILVQDYLERHPEMGKAFFLRGVRRKNA